MPYAYVTVVSDVKDFRDSENKYKQEKQYHDLHKTEVLKL
jgi:hypothetical protein